MAGVEVAGQPRVYLSVGQKWLLAVLCFGAGVAPLAAVKRKCCEARYVIILDFCATPLLYRNYSLTIWAPSKAHCANYERCVTK